MKFRLVVGLGLMFVLVLGSLLLFWPEKNVLTDSSEQAIVKIQVRSGVTGYSYVTEDEKIIQEFSGLINQSKFHKAYFTSVKNGYLLVGKLSLSDHSEKDIGLSDVMVVDGQKYKAYDGKLSNRIYDYVEKNYIQMEE